MKLSFETTEFRASAFQYVDRAGACGLADYIDSMLASRIGRKGKAFELEYAVRPEETPDGDWCVYVDIEGKGGYVLDPEAIL